MERRTEGFRENSGEREIDRHTGALLAEHRDVL